MQHMIRVSMFCNIIQIYRQYQLLRLHKLDNTDQIDKVMLNNFIQGQPNSSNASKSNYNNIDNNKVTGIEDSGHHPYYEQYEQQYQECSIIMAAGAGQGSLLIGDFNSATNPDILRKYNIRTVITAAVGMEHLKIPTNCHAPLSSSSASSHGNGNSSILHITYPLLDSPSQNISQFFNHSHALIQTNLHKGSVLVHCAAGISRSATLVIAYIMKIKKIGFKDAIKQVRIGRPSVRPNLGFQRQLKMYQKQILGENQQKGDRTIQDEQIRRVNLKKTISQKMSEERRTGFNRSSHLGKLQLENKVNLANNKISNLKHQSRTAQEPRRKNQQKQLNYLGEGDSHNILNYANDNDRLQFQLNNRKGQYPDHPHSQSRPRNSKNNNKAYDDCDNLKNPYPNASNVMKKNFKVRPLAMPLVGPVGKDNFLVQGFSHINVGLPHQKIGNKQKGSKQQEDIRHSQGNNIKSLQQMGGYPYSEQIKPPLIQNHHKNAITNNIGINSSQASNGANINGWMKFNLKKYQMQHQF